MSRGNEGWPGPTQVRLALVAQVDALREEGTSTIAIANRLGKSRNYIADLINDQTGEKGWKRKRSYSGTCEVCGARTDGSNGRTRTPRFCHAHSNSARAAENWKWPRERVIEAVQAWAAEHDGFPPGAHEWRKISDDGRFPSASLVYGSTNSPFKKWADAIEAAGFPRPRTGKRRREKSNWSREKVIEELQRRATYGYAANTDSSLYQAANYYFGGYANAVAAAGLKLKQQHHDLRFWTAEEVIAEIQTLAIGDLPPRLSEIAQGAVNVAYGCFGSWKEAVRAAGYEPYTSGPSKRSKRRTELVKLFRGEDDQSE